MANWEKDERKPILCDIDHSSVDTGKTSAAGWVLELKVDADAKRLKGILVVSEKGAELLNGLEYRYISPVLLFKDDNYPYYLDSVSLTNTPRIKELKPEPRGELIGQQRASEDAWAVWRSLRPIVLAKIRKSPPSILAFFPFSVSAVRIDAPVDWHRPHAGTEEIQHLVHLVQPQRRLALLQFAHKPPGKIARVCPLPFCGDDTAQFPQQPNIKAKQP